MTSKIVYQGFLHTQAEHCASGSLIETDAPVDNNGKGERFSPTDLAATSLGTCMLTVMGIASKGKPYSLDQTIVEVEKVMGINPRRITEIRIRMKFPEELSISREEQTYLERVALNCPVSKSLHPDIKQDITFAWH